MKELAKILRTQIANCFLAWFKSRDLSSESELIEAFCFPLVQANPHTIFGIVLETDNPFPIEILAELLAYASNPGQFLNRYYLFSSYEENAIYSTQLVVILPIDKEKQFDREWLEELEETVPVIWDWKISTEQGMKKTLKSLPHRGNVLIEFHPDLNKETVWKILGQIKNALLDDPESIQFRDATLQQIWYKEAYKTPPCCEIEEYVITYNTKLEASSMLLAREVF
jgi:hypothetical protein